jgi:hypothetical protein
MIEPHTLPRHRETAPTCVDCAVLMVPVSSFGWICTNGRPVDGRARVCGNTYGEIL